VSVDFQALARPGDQVAIIATTPLTDNEVWTAINSGELLVFQEGAAILS
jgi:glutamine amidotransferase